MATARESPPILGSVILGWRYAFAALSRMPAVLGVGIAIMIGLNALGLPLLLNQKNEASFPAQIADLALGVAQGFFLTPVAIAMHRFVLLGEITERYAFDLSAPRFKQFFVWTVILQVAMTACSFPLSLASSPASALGTSLGMLLVVTILSVRLLILFPAIAIDAAGTAWQNALEDTKGHTWRLFFIVLLTAMPMLVVLVPPRVLWGWPKDTGVTGGLLLTVPQSIVGVLMLCAYAAVASRMFAAWANRLNMPFSRPARVERR